MGQTKRISRRAFGVSLVLSLSTALPVSSVFTQGTYPNKPVRLIVPFPPGGATDIIARDLAPIAVVASVPNVLIVAPNLPVNSPKELASLAKSKPGKLNYGSSSISGTAHLSGELFKSMTGSFIVHIPYRGSSPALQDLVSGNIDLMFDNSPAALPFIKSGRVKALAVTTTKRSPAVPELPTMQEAGMKDFDSQGWFGLLAPTNTPPAMIDRINVEINRILSTADFKEQLQKVGADGIGGTVSDFRDRMGSESERWGKVIKFANITVE